MSIFTLITILALLSVCLVTRCKIGIYALQLPPDTPPLLTKNKPLPLYDFIVRHASKEELERVLAIFNRYGVLTPSNENVMLYLEYSQIAGVVYTNKSALHNTPRLYIWHGNIFNSMTGFEIFSAQEFIAKYE